MVVLDKGVRLATLQFSFSNPAAIPDSVRRLERETIEERVERKNKSTGVMVLQPTLGCSLAQFVGDIEAAEYELVDAFYKERIDGKDTKAQRTYHMVRFVFVRKEHVSLSDEFRRAQNQIRKDLLKICEEAMWRVRSFLNPLYVEGEEVAGEQMLSVNLEARSPFLLPDGQPMVAWLKGPNGERLGVKPRPIRQSFDLRVSKFRHVCLVHVR